VKYLKHSHAQPITQLCDTTAVQKANHYIKKYMVVPLCATNKLTLVIVGKEEEITGKSMKYACMHHKAQTMTKSEKVKPIP